MIYNIGEMGYHRPFLSGFYNRKNAAAKNEKSLSFIGGFCNIEYFILTFMLFWNNV